MVFLEFPIVPVACIHSFTASWRAPPSVVNSFWYSIKTNAVVRGSILMAGSAVDMLSDVRVTKVFVEGAMKAAVPVTKIAMDKSLRKIIVLKAKEFTRYLCNAPLIFSLGGLSLQVASGIVRDTCITEVSYNNNQ